MKTLSARDEWEAIRLEYGNYTIPMEVIHNWLDKWNGIISSETLVSIMLSTITKSDFEREYTVYFKAKSYQTAENTTEAEALVYNLLDKIPSVFNVKVSEIKTGHIKD